MWTYVTVHEIVLQIAKQTKLVHRNKLRTDSNNTAYLHVLYFTAQIITQLWCFYGGKFQRRCATQLTVRMQASLTASGRRQHGREEVLITTSLTQSAGKHKLTIS